jgi:hypothetical protein
VAKCGGVLFTGDSLAGRQKEECRLKKESAGKKNPALLLFLSYERKVGLMPFFRRAFAAGLSAKGGIYLSFCLLPPA